MKSGKWGGWPWPMNGMMTRCKSPRYSWPSKDPLKGHDRRKIIATIAEEPGISLGHAPDPSKSMQGWHQRSKFKKK